MARNYRIIGGNSWEHSSVRWTHNRQNFLQRPWWSTLCQPYPAGCVILGDEQIVISGLPLSIYDKLEIKRFNFNDVAISVDSNSLPVKAFIIASLDLQKNTSSYNIIESPKNPSETLIIPDLFIKVENPLNKNPDKFYIEDIQSINLPLFLIEAPSNPVQKIIYGELANFSQNLKFTVIKLAWGPVSVIQGQGGPILLGGSYTNYLADQQI